MPAAAIARHRTALNRAELSRPLRTAIADGLLRPDQTVTDYGCGRGDDLRRLTTMGYECAGWDPVHAPAGTRREADVVNLGYVVNVIENAGERREALERAWALARRLLVVSARLVDERPTHGASAAFADGILTRLGTFQKFFEQQELRAWIEQALGVPSVAAAPGIFYVFREPGERSAFLASRFRRATAVPRLRVGERLYTEHRELLDGLAGFVSTRGRLPAPFEFERYSELEGALGSLKRAFRVIEASTDASAWAAVRDARVQDTLVFLALSHFEGRPRFHELAPDLQLDIKAFFGSYTIACQEADELLFSLGRGERLEEACRTALVGKLMPNALYVHTSAVGELPVLLRLYEGCARSYVGNVPDANLVKLGRGEPKVSYLSYPDFDRDPHPALASSTSVHLQTFRVRERSYRDYKNPPILHRKECFVSADHRAREKFARLTRQEEARGLYEDPATIGTREGWKRALRARGLALRGHRLIVGGEPTERGDRLQATLAFYERNAAAYAATTLHPSMEQWIDRFTARLRRYATVVDLGCGAGRDLKCFREKGLRPVGLELSPALADIARAHAGVPVMVGDLRSPPFPDSSFDAAWASASLLHLKRDVIGPALDEVRRILRPGGTFFISMKRGRGEAQCADGRWFTYVEPTELRRLVEDAGFEVVDMHTEPRVPLRRDQPWISCLAVAP